jgi:hypothetical protein
MARLALVVLLLTLIGCGSSKEIVLVPGKPYPVRVLVPVDVCVDESFRQHYLVSIGGHEDFRAKLDSTSTEEETVKATLLELRWRELWLDFIADYFQPTPQPE